MKKGGIGLNIFTIRMLGSVLIMLCSAKIGFEEAGRFKRRVEEIREFQTALVALKGEICFCRSPLAEALVKTGERLETAVAEIFITAGKAIGRGEAAARTAWETAVFSTQKKLALKNGELHVINTFGGLLGISDEAGQLENIELTTAKLIACEKKAAEDEQKNSKVYKSLGIAAGIFLAIIFI